ncbi:MAG TPA: AIR synthase-related protein, partial [Terriglobia bacterium]|nr:AIR synthase-related protein [Terriglobia bacterium]
NTAGIGLVESSHEIRPSAVRPGDAVIVSGSLGAHGVAILSVREGLEFESIIESDSAPLWEPVRAALQAGIAVHCLRDLTRGGLSSGLNEIAEAAQVSISIDESLIPVTDPVRSACEILGLDPLYVANEGRFVAFVPEGEADRTVELLREFAVCSAAVKIGAVGKSPEGLVSLKSRIGGHRVLDMLSGEQLPRIC